MVRSTRRSTAFLLAAALAGCAKSSSPPPASSGHVPIDPSRPGDTDFAAALIVYDAATTAQRAGYAARNAGDTAAAQAYLADATAKFIEARAMFDTFATNWCGAAPAQGQTSIRCDNSAYLAGRCSYEIGTMSDLASDFQDAIARLDAMEATYPSSAMKDSAAYFDGRAHFQLKEWEPAKTQFLLSLSADPAGPWADNSQYYVGRCWFEEGFAFWNVVPHPAPGTAEYVTASADFTSAQAELGRVLSAYPTSPYVVNAEYYLGKTDLFFPYDTSAPTPNADRVSNLNTAIGWFGTVIANAGLFVASSHYERGQCHYDLAFEYAAGAVLDAGELSLALVDLKQVPPPGVYADNALSDAARCYVHLPSTTDATGTYCTSARAGDPAPASACAAYAALTNLVSSNAAYAASTYPATTQSYLSTYGCTCP